MFDYYITDDYNKNNKFELSIIFIGWVGKFELVIQKEKIDSPLVK